jgi:putative FmdB family regulatory protein
MPTYEYICHLCNHRFEHFQNIQAEPIKICPLCNSDKVERILTGGIGLIFKGQGFYITDYKKSRTESKAETMGLTKEIIKKK